MRHRNNGFYIVTSEERILYYPLLKHIRYGNNLFFPALRFTADPPYNLIFLNLTHELYTVYGEFSMNGCAEPHQATDPHRWQK